MLEAKSGLLTINWGNTTFDCYLHGSGTRLQLDSTAPDLPRLVEFTRGSAHRCVIASVAPVAAAAAEDALRRAGVAVAIAMRDVGCPMPLDYETPATLGADRWLGAFAAFRLFGRSLVVDCGTATTVNLVGGEGVFRGGSIAPGLRAFVAGMAAVTGHLPAPRLDATPSLPARSSQAAVDTGVLLGYCGLVERLVADHLRCVSGTTQVVLTGGNAERLRRQSRLRAHFEPVLVHRGLALLAEDVAWSC